MGKFKKPVFDEVSQCYRIQWSDIAYLTENIVVDKLVIHEIDEYYTLPEGGRFMKRYGIPNVWEYKVVKHDVEHVYKVVRAKLADGTFVNTIEHPLKNLGDIFSAELLARLFCLKYDFSMT